ncbi:hypothetical protein D3C79_1051950 [compost metagenome]
MQPGSRQHAGLKRWRHAEGDDAPDKQGDHHQRFVLQRQRQGYQRQGQRTKQQTQGAFPAQAIGQPATQQVADHGCYAEYQ